MEELRKINRIIDSKAADSSREVLLVLDATTGQNAVSQAKLFSETAPITGIVLTRLDGTAKGGIVISIKNELGIPVKLIGVGEKIDDLQPFDSRMFVDALFDMPAPEEDDEDEETTVPETESEESEAPEHEADDESEDVEEADYDEDESDDEDYDDDESDEDEDEDASDDEEDDGEGFDVDNFDENAEFTARTEFDIDESFMESLAEEKAAEEADEDEDYDYDDEDEEESEDEAEEDEEEAPAEPEKKKKKGFFSRLFGRKDDDEDDEDDE
jgi:hypothetical protein